jgi:hypothetical protein
MYVRMYSTKLSSSQLASMRNVSRSQSYDFCIYNYNYNLWKGLNTNNTSLAYILWGWGSLENAATDEGSFLKVHMYARRKLWAIVKQLDSLSTSEWLGVNVSNECIPKVGARLYTNRLHQTYTHLKDCPHRCLSHLTCLGYGLNV